MKIKKLDADEWISIKTIDYETEVHACIQIEVSVKSAITLHFGREESIWFSYGDIEAFIEELKKLDETRKGNATLDSHTPEGFKLAISNKDELGHLLLAARFIKQQTDYNTDSTYDITIRYEIDPSSINSIITDLKGLIPE